MTTPAMVIITNNYPYDMPNACYASGLIAHCTCKKNKKQTKKELNEEFNYISVPCLRV